MRESPTLAFFAEALAAAQKQIEHAKREHTARVASKKGEGSSYSYNYASLDAVVDVIRGPLADNGLSFIQFPSVQITETGTNVSLTTRLFHKSGEYIESDPLTLRVADSLPQTVGSGITYARRYSLVALVGVAFDTDDDDGQRASGIEGGETAPRQFLPNCPQCGKPDKKKPGGTVIAGSPQYGAGLVCWKKDGVSQGCGHQWQTEEHPFTDKRANDPAHQPRVKAPPPPSKLEHDVAAVFDDARRKFHGKGSPQPSDRDPNAPPTQSGLHQQRVPGQLFPGETEPQAPPPSVERNAQAMAQQAPQTNPPPRPAIELLKDHLRVMGCNFKGDCYRVIQWGTNGKYQATAQTAPLDEIAKSPADCLELLQNLKDGDWTLEKVMAEIEDQKRTAQSA